MPIVTELGITTAELCPASKKYLSRLLAGRILVGAKIKNRDFISWEELLGTETDELGEDLTKRLNWQLQKNAKYNEPFNEESLIQHIVDKLAEIETSYLPERLKPYDPEVKKQQEELHHKKRALISLAIFVVLAVAFPFALPLLGGAAILFGVAFSVTEATLLVYSISAYIGERLSDPEWYKEHSIQEEKWQKKISEITTKTEIMIGKAEEPISNKQISNVKQREPLMVEAATQTTNDYDIGKPPIICNISFLFKAEKQSIVSEQKTIVPQCTTS
jgi:hypothetical protein